jgi:hypothetical protein
MAEKSFENENKVYVMTLKQPCKSDPNHPKAWKSGRGEVARFVLEFFLMYLATFILFFIFHKKGKCIIPMLSGARFLSRKER